MGYVVSVIDISAALVVGFSALRATFIFFRTQIGREIERSDLDGSIRIPLASGLLLGIDLEVGSDILRTILIPSLADLLILSVVVALRIVLSWTLSSRRQSY